MDKQIFSVNEMANAFWGLDFNTLKLQLLNKISPHVMDEIQFSMEESVNSDDAIKIIQGLPAWINAGEKLDIDWRKLYHDYTLNFKFDENGNNTDSRSSKINDLALDIISFYPPLSTGISVATTMRDLSSLVTDEKEKNNSSVISITNGSLTDSPYTLSPKDIFEYILNGNLDLFYKQSAKLYLSTFDYTVSSNSLNESSKDVLRQFIENLHSQSKNIIISKRELALLQNSGTNSYIDYNKLLVNANKAYEESLTTLDNALADDPSTSIDESIITETERRAINAKSDELSFYVMSAMGDPSTIFGFNAKPRHHLSISQIEKDMDDYRTKMLKSFKKLSVSTSSISPNSTIDETLNNVPDSFLYGLLDSYSLGGKATRYAIAQYYDAFPDYYALSSNKVPIMPEDIKPLDKSIFGRLLFTKDPGYYSLRDYLILPSLHAVDDNFLWSAQLINELLESSPTDSKWKIKANSYLEKHHSLDWFEDMKKLKQNFDITCMNTLYSPLVPNHLDHIPRYLYSLLPSYKSIVPIEYEHHPQESFSQYPMTEMQYNERTEAINNSFFRYFKFPWDIDPRLLKAQGGRATEASIFGEAGPEWAIPERHDTRTAELLNSAREASGFSWNELLASTGGLNGGGPVINNNFSYSPTIHTDDSKGMEEVLRRDKQYLDDWWEKRQWELARNQWR